MKSTAGSCGNVRPPMTLRPNRIRTARYFFLFAIFVTLGIWTF